MWECREADEYEKLVLSIPLTHYQQGQLLNQFMLPVLRINYGDVP